MKDDAFAKSVAYAETSHVLSNFSGLIVGNLECPLTLNPALNTNKISLTGDPAHINHIPFVNIVSLANNHISDAGSNGVEETLHHLRRKGVASLGYGENMFEARKPLFFERDGIRIGFLAYSCLTTNGENYSTSVKDGVCPIALKYLEDDIRKLREDVDHIVVLLHWGEENNHYPTPDQVHVAHKIVDFGGSVVIGTHPHVIQGVETYKNGIIAYSLGNFILSDLEFDVTRDNRTEKRVFKQNEANKESLGIEVSLTKDNVQLKRIIGFKSDEYFLPQIVPLEQLRTNFHEISTNLNNYIQSLSSYISGLDGLRIKVEFNGAIYQNRYSLETIDKITPVSPDIT